MPLRHRSDQPQRRHQPGVGQHLEGALLLRVEAQLRRCPQQHAHHTVVTGQATDQAAVAVDSHGHVSSSSFGPGGSRVADQAGRGHRHIRPRTWRIATSLPCVSSGEGSRDRVWTFDDFATRATYLVVLTLAALSPAQQDVWWLLRAGEDIWHTASVPTVDHYSFTADGRYWPNHEWLWEAIAYPLHLVGGMPLLTLASSLAALGAVVIARRTSAARGYVVPAVLIAC